MTRIPYTTENDGYDDIAPYAVAANSYYYLHLLHASCPTNLNLDVNV